MIIKIIKSIISNNGEEFKLRHDVGFCLCRNDKEYNCFGIIKKIEEDIFIIDKVEIDGMHMFGTLEVKYSEVKDGNLHHIRRDYESLLHQ